MDATQKSNIRFRAFIMALSSIDPYKISCHHLLDTIESSERKVEILLRYASSEIVAVNKASQAIFWALTVASCMRRKSVQISGRWENVIWKIVELLRNWKKEYDLELSPVVSKSLKPWILRMFSHPSLCPNPYLRLEMLRFISMWPDKYLQDATAGQHIVTGLVDMIAYLQVDILIYSESKTNLFYHLISVFNSLNKCGHVKAVAAAAVTQVRNLNIGKEAAFFSHILQLLNHKADAIRDMYLTCLIDAMQTANKYDEIFGLFEVLLFTLPTMAAYECPGLVHVAAASLVNFISSLVSMGPNLKLEKSLGFLLLFSNLDVFFVLLERSMAISTVLVLDHAHILAFVNKRAAEFGFSFHHFPKLFEESSDPCPEEFVDSVTGAVMEAPVLLHSSKMVVDESTLVQLLLMTPLDPFTRCPLDQGSYSRLPDLQADIAAWRNTRSHIQVHSTDNNIPMKVVSTDEMESDIGDVEMIMDTAIHSNIDKSDCPLQILLSQFDYV
ncbi:uncharacterized protein [Procambarus clarkii]|uniref:uncharacterized protein n=1 Tax=Procambarus clarkii TaxID=6728 RepID=UPI00374406A4